MMKTTSRSPTIIVTMITVLMVGEAMTFLLAALLHLGIQLPLGFAGPACDTRCKSRPGSPQGGSTRKMTRRLFL